MHNSLLPEVMETIRLLDSGEIVCLRDLFYLEVPKDRFSPFRPCIIVLERYEHGWDISIDKNFQFVE